MELDLQYAALEGFQPVLDTVLTQEETMESIVPDAYPDVSRIVWAGGNAFLTTKQASEGTAKVMGTVCADVIYIPEGDTAPRSLALKLPFQCVGDCPHINDNTQIHAAVLSVCMDAHLVNPRKIFLKAEVKLSLKAYNREARSVTCGVSTESNELQLRMQEQKSHIVPAVLEKAFLFSDTLRQSTSKPTMEELLYCRMTPAGVEAKCIGNKLVCKGELSLFVLYRTGTEIFATQFEMPFSQILELECTFSEGETDVSLVLKNTECGLNDGELNVSIEALLQAVLYSQHSVMMLTDLYSTAVPLDVERTACPVCTMFEQNSRREAVRKFCESGIPAKQVLGCFAAMNPLMSRSQDNSVQYNSDANVDVLYISEDGALCAVNYTVSVGCDVNVPAGCTCSCQCRPIDETLAVPVTGGFEVRLEAEFSWQIMRLEPVPNVVSVRKSPITVVCEQRPSVIIRMVSEGDSLWDIAKSCSSTIQDICAANELTSENINSGTVLLIPTHR